MKTNVIIQFKFEGNIPENEIDFTDLIRDSDGLESINVFVDGEARNSTHILKVLIQDNLQQIIRKIMKPTGFIGDR